MKKELIIITFGQILSNISSALILLLGIYSSEKYYVELQRIFAFYALCGFFHFGLVDAIFQEKIENKILSKIPYKQIKIFIIFSSTIFSLIIGFYYAYEPYYTATMVIGALLINLNALNNSINSGEGKIDIYIKSLIIEKIIFISLILVIIILKNEVIYCWVLIPIAIASVYIEIKTKIDLFNNAPLKILRRMRSGVFLMLQNISYAGVIPLSIFIVTNNKYENQREIIISLSVISMIVSYMVQYNMVFLSKRKLFKNISSNIYAEITILFFVIACLFFLRNVESHQGIKIGLISDLLMIMIPYVYIEYRNQLGVIVNLRLAGKINRLLIGNISGLIVLGIGFYSFTNNSENQEYAISFILVLASFIRALFYRVQ